MNSLRLLSFFAAAVAMAQPAADPVATARKALDALLAGKYADVQPMLTPEMQKDYSEAALAKLGTQIQSSGPVSKIDDPTTQKVGPNTIVVFPVHFEKQNLNFRYIVNPRGLVAGMFLLPGEITWQRPAYSKPGSFQERAVTIGTDEWKLPGTLTVPEGNGPFPAVVLVHGSGPNDRDQTVGGTRVFRDLAEGLGSRGIVVLRYEKRTRQYPRTAGLHDMTIDDEIVEDAGRAAEVVRAQKEVDPRRVYVLAHSVGGYISPRIAEEDGKLAGLILLAANARPIEDLAVDQAQSAGISGKELDSIKAAAKRVKSLEPADEDSPPVMGLPVPYLLDLKGYDPVAELKKLNLRVLVLQGERDFQTTMKDFELWKTGLAGKSNVTFHSYPALNHLFVAGEGKSTEAEYRKPGHVAPEVIEDIGKWIAQ